MAPQARSETTRQKLLDAAIDLFTQVGYAAAGLGEIIERTGMTKGALYHHFDSKEALATAIIEQGGDLTRAAFRQVCESSSPALENLIHGAFIVTAKASIPTWLANQPLTPYSAPNCTPGRQAATITSND
jgi:AcrR family transcriptional regulator